jgi:hypothetical protein
VADDSGFSGSRLLRGAANPAAPAGLRQTSERLATNQQRYEQGDSRLRPWMPQESMLETAKSWYAGANSQGTTNGWDTDFYRNTFTQMDQWQSKAMSANRGSVFYGWLDPQQNPQATGVATWDDPSKDVAFGDVFNNGRKVGNLYQDYDQATADVMVGEFLFEDQEKQRMFRDPNRNAIYREQVEARRKENTDRALYAKSAEDFDDNVKARERQLTEGLGNEATIAGSAAATAAMGAGAGAVLGSIVPVFGTAAGAIVGGVVGGVAGAVGGWLNQDQLVEMTARTQEKADLANQRFAGRGLQQFAMQAGDYAQLGMKLISPLSNIHQGIADAKYGEIGDMSAEFYEVDADGNRKVSTIEKAGDILATLGDSVLQFASPIGRWMYMGTMGATVAGGVGELTTGTVFNERRGQYDQLEGWKEWSAAIGSTAIDASQVGIAGAFSRAASSSRAAFTGSKDLTADTLTTTGRLGLSNGKITTSGITFRTDPVTGKVLSARMSVEAIAPSEFLRWIPAGARARKLARIDGGEMTRDHLLKASLELTGNGSRFRDAVILGYAEGGEEFVQAYLDPLATGDRASFGAAFEASLYGAAGGMGMALGPSNTRASSKQVMEARAFVEYSRRTGYVPSDDEWSQMTKGWKPADFERMAKADAKDTEQVNAMLATMADLHRQDRAHHSAIGFAKMEDAKLGTWEKLNKKALEEGNGSLVLMGQSGEFLTTMAGTVEKAKFAPNSGVMSAYEMVTQIGLISDGMKAQRESIAQQIAEAQKLRDAATGDQRDRFEDELKDLLARRDDLANQQSISKQVSDAILRLYEAFANETDTALMPAHIERMNELLRRAYTGQWVDSSGNLLAPDLQRLVQRSVELKIGRHPFIDRGSFALLMPQVSEELTKLNAHGTVYLHQGMLKSLGADHDGDTGVPQHTVYLSEADHERLRRGDQYVRLVEDKDGRATVDLSMDAPDGEWAYLRAFSDAMLDPSSLAAQTTTKRIESLLSTLRAEFSQTFGGPLDDTALDTLLAEFKEAVLAGREDARKVLVEKMFALDYEGMRNHDNLDNVPNALWIWGKVNETWDILQKDLAHVRATTDRSVPIEPQREAAETRVRSEIARRDAANAGGTLAMLSSEPVRGAQFMHYAMLFRSATELPGGDGGFTTDQQLRLTQLFMELGSGQSAKDIELITGRNAIEERVFFWLGQMANSVQDTRKTVPELMMLLANTSVPSVEMAPDLNTYTVVEGQITLLQLLLRRSLDIEAAKHRAAEPDSDIVRKIAKLRRMTYRDPDRSKHSYTAMQAVAEVFGDHQLHELLGGSSAYISPQMTMNQLTQQLRGLHPRERRQLIHRLERSPAYLKDRNREYKDPPWPASVLSDGGQINAFAMLVDAVKVAGDTYVPAMRERDVTIQRSFEKGLAGLHEMMAAHRLKHSDRLGRGTDEVTSIRVLRDMLNTDVRLAQEIAKLIPDAAALGVFQVHDDNTVTAAKWLEQMLVEKDTAKAAATYYLHIKIAEFNVLGGTVRIPGQTEDEDDDGTRKQFELEDVRGTVDPGSLKSRFLQVLFHLGAQPDQIELMRFLRAMSDAPSVEKMFEILNSEPGWRNNQEELLPWHDDVALFEVDPKDVWNNALDGSLQRENIRGWGERMSVLGSVAVEAQVNHDANTTLLHAMDEWLTSGQRVNRHDAAAHLALLKKAIENRKRFPDTNGQVARSQLVELLQIGLARMQDKGKADPMAAPFGEPLITLDSFGFSDGLRQEMAALTAEDIEDVRTNLTLLVDSPTRIMLEDGSTIVFDITNERSALDMLMDPRTQGLAMSILFPTVRDVNASNVVQNYVDTDSKGNLSRMLKEQTFAHLFEDRSEYGERLKQAHRFIGMVESYIRKDAVGRTQAERDKAFFPIQNMIHEFVVAYTHSLEQEERNPQHVRDQLFIDVADAIKAVYSVAPESRPNLREIVVAALEQRFLDNSTRMDDFIDGDTIRKSLVELKLAEKQFESFSSTIADFDSRRVAAAAQGDTAEMDKIRREKLDYLTEYRRIQARGISYPHQTYTNAKSVLNMFNLTGDPAQDGTRKAEILAYLGKQNRIHKLEKKKHQDLYHKAHRIIYQDPLEAHSPVLDDKEWGILGSWAAELYLDDLTSRSSSSVPASGALLGDDGEAVRRVFDASFSYLIDGLFDPKVLEAVDVMSQGSLYTAERDSKAVAKMLMGGLLSDKRLGTWTEIIPAETLKARQVLKNSPVGAAISQEGNDPKELSDYIGAGKVTWKLPEPAHMSTATLAGNARQTLADLLTEPLAWVKLENHFVSRVTVQSTDPANPLPPEVSDLLASVTHVNHTSAETRDAGEIAPGKTALRVLDMNLLHDQLEQIKDAYGLPGFTLEIEYVDVNKKPYAREWANNIFFDGAGRELVGGSGLGAIASLFFGLGGLSKVGQQNPLDMAAKAGMGFRPHKRSPLTTAETMEKQGATIASILATKAEHLLAQDYPMGKLLRSDLPSLYKLMKMRHVVVGYRTNPDGKKVKEVWWPEQFIELEESGAPIPLEDVELVPLSDSVAQTLWGGASTQGVKGTRGALTRPIFDVQRMDVFPSLEAPRLRELGLERLGERGDVANSRLAQVSVPPRATATYSKGKSIISQYRKRLNEWRGQAMQVNTLRMGHRRAGEGNLDINRINSANSEMLLAMLNPETQAAAMKRLGIPEQGLMDLAALQTSRMLAGRIKKIMESENNMIWVHRHGKGGDLTQGFVGRADVEGNFAGFNGMGPTYGDVVVIDLSDILATTDVKDYRDAANEAAKIIKEYSKRGVIVALQSSQGEQDLRAAVTEDLTDGSLGYRPMAESGHFFVPITEEADYNAAQRALASTLLETQQYTTKNVALRLVADGINTALTESVEYIDSEHDRAYNTISHTLLPYTMVGTGNVGERNPFAYHIPTRGEGLADQLSKVNAELLELLKSPEGRVFLKEILGPDDGSYRKYRELPNGTVELGVLPLDDALDRLQHTIEAGKHPLDKNQVFMWGTIIPFVSGDGSIHLSRVGFKQPNVQKMREQRQVRYQDKVRKITGADTRIDDKQTVPPPTTIDEVRTDNKGLSVVGTYETGAMAKMVSEGIGLKAGFAPMPSGYRFPDAVMRAAGAAGMRLTRMMGSTSVVGKDSRRGMVNNFRDGFAVTGISFKDDMVNFIFGEDPTRSPEEGRRLWDLAHSVLEDWASYPHSYTAEELSRGLDTDSVLISMEARFNAIGRAVAPDSWRDIDIRPTGGVEVSPTMRLGTIIMAALAAPGVKVEHVIETAGLTTVKDHDTGSLVRLMPALMTDALNDPAHPDLRKMLIARMNRNMPRNANGDLEYWFDNELKFHVRMTQDINGTPREEEVVGFLQVHLPVPADENAIRLSQAAISSGGPQSKHIADVVAGAIGGRETPKPKKRPNLPDRMEEFYGDNEIERFDGDNDVAAFIRMLTRVRTDSPTYTPWQRKLPMEEIHLERADAKVRQYTYLGERTKETGWSENDKTEVERLSRDFLNMLNITDAKAVAEVEYLVRQLFGIPGPAKDQADYNENLSAEVMKTGIEFMKRNLIKGLHPLHGGMVPLEHEAFWKMVFDAQRGLPDSAQWRPLMDGSKKTKQYATTWADWVNTLHGQMRESSKSFNSRFRTDLDGFYHTYQGVTPDFMVMASSTSEEVTTKLFDEETNRPYLSIDPGRDAVLRDPIILDSQYMTYDALMGRDPVTTMEEGETTESSVLAKRIADIERWQRGEELPRQKDLTVKQYAMMGAAYQESQRRTTNVYRNLLNLSVTTRLFNPALWFSAIFEVPFRAALENATDVLTGQKMGVSGRAIAGVGGKLEQNMARLGLEGIKLTPALDTRQIDLLNDLGSQLGDSNKWLGEVYGELTYQSVVGGGQGRLGGLLERTATGAARMTADPRWGLQATSLGRRYVNAAWEYLSMTNSQITVEQFVQMMKENPLWLKEQSPELGMSAHRMGLNAVQQARGAKATMMGNTLMAPIDAMTQSNSTFINGLGTALKIPFLFTRFNANMLLTLSGMSMFDQAAALFLDGRKRPQLVKKMLNNAKITNYDLSKPEVWDNSDVIESLDLSRAFVRGAVTHTGLMAAAMLANGFALGGEDEEERRRKKLATYLNTPYYLDPRKASNDWRWSDAIFLDNVPILNMIYRNETGHSAVVPHWIVQQFLAPVLGMMRFFETGNINEIRYGYEEVASVLPNSVTRLWDQASMTSQLLVDAAADEELIPEKQEAMAQLVTNIVFVFEKALLENAFVNGLYTARDEFDRNPWAIPELSETGQIVREEGTGEPVQSPALQAYQVGEGEEASNRVGYATRKGMDALLHQYTENNATAAVMLSILPWLQGEDTTYLRGNMVTKKQRVQVDEADKAAVEALIYSTYNGLGGQEFLTKEEIIYALKNQEEAAGRRWVQADVEARADSIYASFTDRPLSVFDSEGQQILSQDGVTGIYRSLWDGVIDLDNPAIMGFNVSQEMRDAIAEEWTTELVQEGIDLGLSEQSANFRMRRIWYGDSTRPNEPGLRELLYDKRIPSKPYVEYDQLNVTYVLGPDGKPWATPFSKQNVMQVIGVPMPSTMAQTIPGVTSRDQRGNTIDLIRGINTGQAALQPRPIADDIEANDDAVTKAEAKSYTPGGGYKAWSKFPRRSYGSGGYGGSSYGPNFQRMQPLPSGTAPRTDGIPMINTNTPYVRRASVHRERITSERGRLKQWQ